MIERPPASLWAQAGIVAGLAAVIAVRHWFHAITPTPLNDEIPYLRAVDLVLSGSSPYSRGVYLYPPFFAVAGARIVESFGAAPFLWLLRGLSYLGMALTVWIGLLVIPWRRWFLPAAVAFLCLAPAVTFTIVIHNISPLVAGGTLLALLAWPRHPVGAGLLLGLCVVLKPMVFLVPFLLFLHRPRAGGWAHRIAAGVAFVTTGLLLWLPPYLSEMLTLATKPMTIPRSVSFHRLAYLAGWEEGALWVSVVIALAGVVVVRRFELGRLELLVVAIIASLMATPVLWSHTLVLAIPVQTLVLERLYRRRREGRLASRLEPVFVVLAVAAIQLSGGAISTDDQSIALQVYSTLPFAVAPAALAAYLMTTGGCTEPVAQVRISC